MPLAVCKNLIRRPSERAAPVSFRPARRGPNNIIIEIIGRRVTGRIQRPTRTADDARTLSGVVSKRDEAERPTKPPGERTRRDCA